MELDLMNQNNLDSSISNNTYSNATALNVPIKRGKLMMARRRILPYYNADGDMIFAEAPILSAEAAPAPVFEQASVQQNPIQEQQVFIPTETVFQTSSEPAPVETIVAQTSNVPYNIPSETVQVSNTTPVNEQPVIVAESSSNPVVAADEYGNPVGNVNDYGDPIVQATPTSTTASTPTNTVTAPRTSVPTMPMGGGGGGSAPASTKTTTTTQTTPSGIVTKQTVVETKHGMSTGAKLGIVALLIVGGYFAYKNRAKLGF